MKQVALDPANYEGTYKLIGEEISFDFLNTISWRGTKWQHDWLHSPQNFIAWALAAGIATVRKAKELKMQSNAVLADQLKQVHAIRNDLYNILTPFVHHKELSTGSIEKINNMIHKIVKHRHIDSKTHQWIWDDPQNLAEVLAPVIWNAALVITDLDRSRIKYCPACEWVFYDTTKNRGRKWCDMEDCGSRDKSLRYYHRSKKTFNHEDTKTPGLHQLN
jgi:predicted RNA-binding Zn ribbon-like protein